MPLAQRPSRNSSQPQFYDPHRPKLAALALILIVVGIALALLAVSRG